MLSRVYEWSRVIQVSPDDDTIAKRKVSIEALVEAASNNPELLINCALAAVAGVTPKFEQGSTLVTAVVEAVRAQHPAFPEDLAENKLDLRVCCALVVGEILERASVSTTMPSKVAQLTAALICSGLQQRAISGGKYLIAMLSELTSIALAAAQHCGELRRRPRTLGPFIDAIKEAGDVPSFWKAAQPTLKQMTTAIDANAALDREEVNVLWWAYNGISKTSDQPFCEMQIGGSVICAGAELANLSLLPALPNLRQLVRRVVRANRNVADLADRSLKDYANHWKDGVEKAFNIKGDVADFVKLNPSIFPISWSCLRIADDAGSAWLSELKKVSGWDPNVKLAPETYALQAFNERVAQRVYGSLE
jgi:hypothetical protein